MYCEKDTCGGVQLRGLWLHALIVGLCRVDAVDRKYVQKKFEKKSQGALSRHLDKVYPKMKTAEPLPHAVI